MNRNGSRSGENRNLSIEQLRACLKGRVISPEDTDFDALRTVFAGGIDRRPAVITRPANTEDVVKIVMLAKETGLELAVRGGGHSSAGHGVTAGGIVLDLRDMRAIQIDENRRTAWAESGLTAGEFTSKANEYGLAAGFGDTASVGIGGITLGGGVGYLSRKYGLTIDNLLAAEIVTADGKVLQVDEKSHPDLFWAIRGGGGNFGVVSRFQFKLHPVDKIVGGMLILPATAETIASFMAEAEAAPEELGTIVNIMPAPPMPFLPKEAHGQFILMAMMAYFGPIEKAEKVLAPFRAIAKPIVDMVKPIRYPEMFPPEADDYHPSVVSRSLYVDKTDLGTANKIVEFLHASDAPVRVAQLRALGGAVARIPGGATAYAHRDAQIMVNVAAFYNGPDEKVKQESWVKDFAGALSQGHSGVYVNFLADEGEERIREAYPGGTWERLAAVKARYDPDNLFRLNQNVTPSIG
ncbi:MAG: FAD-binding oxidoreductase [Anaerolineaceae bacterium]